jgi:hypothetical protein
MKLYLSLLVVSLFPGFLKGQDAGTIPGKRAHHAMVFDEKSQRVILTAGSTPLNGGSSFRFYNDIWSFDGKKWKNLGSSGDERSGVALAYDSKRNQIVSMGGFKNNMSLGDLRVLDKGEWKTLSSDPQMLAAEGGLVYDSGRDRLIAFGGSSARGELNSTTWEWDGTSWKKFEIPGPEGRMGFAMVYDSKRKKTIVYGGMGKTPQDLYSDIWEYDGTSWTKISAPGPGPRLSAGFTYNERQGTFVIFGGMTGSGSQNDTWAWDGTEWKKLSESGPSARSMGYLAYDKKRDRIVMFGGRTSWPNDSNETWEFDGKEWKQIKL